MRNFDTLVAGFGAAIIGGLVAGLFGWIYAVPAIAVMGISLRTFAHRR